MPTLTLTNNSSELLNRRAYPLFFRSDKHNERQSRSVGDRDEPRSSAQEERLVSELRSLSEAAWEEVYQRHARQVYGYIYFRVGDQHVAEDLAADVFARAVAGIANYGYRNTPFLAWLYRIAHNVTVDYRKAAVQRSQHQAEVPDDLPAHGDSFRQLDDRRDMLTAIRGLTEVQQQVIILRFYKGMSILEVASIIGKPEGAVKALQTRALRSLRRGMTQQDELERSA